MPISIMAGMGNSSVKVIIIAIIAEGSAKAIIAVSVNGCLKVLIKATITVVVIDGTNKASAVCPTAPCPNLECDDLKIITFYSLFDEHIC